MKTKAFIFPGQGVQKRGMASDIFGSYDVATDVAGAIGRSVDIDILDLINNGTDEQLRESRNAQLAIFTVSMAIWHVIQANKSVDFFDNSYYAGHSLGEYSALCAAGYISLDDCAKLIYERGGLMNDICKSGDYGMYAVIGSNADCVGEIIAKYDGQNGGHLCRIANDNSPNQIVISGHSDLLELVVADIKQAGAKAIKLNTAGPFHTTLMSGAAEKFGEYVRNFSFNDEPIKSNRIIVSNLTGSELKNKDDLYEILPSHIQGAVLWRDTINGFIGKSMDLVEIGPGNVQTKMVSRDFGYDNIINIDSVEAIENFVK